MKKIHFIILSSVMLLGFAARKPAVKEPPFYPCSEIVFWEAVKMAESGGKPNTCYEESDGSLSCGLYQLSLSDANIYGCNFKTKSDLFDPVKNADCKDKIKAKLRRIFPTEPWDNALARYWGTLRSKKNPMWKKWHERNPNHKGYVNFQRFAKERGCLIKD